MCQARRASSSGDSRGDGNKRFRPADHLHHAEILQHQAVAILQHHRTRQVEQEDGAALTFQHDAAAMPLVGIKHHPIHRLGVIPGIGGLDGKGAQHGQNRK